MRVFPPTSHFCLKGILCHLHPSLIKSNPSISNDSDYKQQLSAGISIIISILYANSDHKQRPFQDPSVAKNQRGCIQICLQKTSYNNPLIQMSSMEDIASNKFRNVFWAPSNKGLLETVNSVYNRLCTIEPINRHEYIEPKKIINQFTYEASSRYKNNLNTVPSWMPFYKPWKNGQIPYFTYERET